MFFLFPWFPKFHAEIWTFSVNFKLIHYWKLNLFLLIFMVTFLCTQKMALLIFAVCWNLTPMESSLLTLLILKCLIYLGCNADFVDDSCLTICLHWKLMYLLAKICVVHVIVDLFYHFILQQMKFDSSSSFWLQATNFYYYVKKQIY